jgi:chaperonin GroEL (HSP60 family)
MPSGSLSKTKMHMNEHASALHSTKVSRTALQHAASVVGLLLTTEVLISEAPEVSAAPPDGLPPRRGGRNF